MDEVRSYVRLDLPFTQWQGRPLDWPTSFSNPMMERPWCRFRREARARERHRHCSGGQSEKRLTLTGRLEKRTYRLHNECPVSWVKRTCTSVHAALRGAAIGSVALLLFAPLFVIVYVWTEPATEHANILGLAVVLLVRGAFEVWRQVALVGAAVGWGLHRFASRDG
jgi:hypothetical protein